MKKAWRTNWGGMESIVSAETRGQAAARTMRAVEEVYGQKQSWKGLRVRRAPEYDAWAELDATGNCWDEACLPRK